MVLERLKTYIDYKHITVSAFEKSINMSNASFGKSLKNGGAIGSDKLEYILTIYKDLNPIWLLTGKGEMLTSIENLGTQIQSHNDSILLKLLSDRDNTIAKLNREIGRLENELKQKWRNSEEPLRHAAESESKYKKTEKLE